MSEKLNSKIAVIGIDIGKNSFHIVGQDRRGALVLRQKLSRGQVEARLANLPPCLIGMEAFTGAHHLSRKLQALCHDAQLMPAKYVRPRVMGPRARWIGCGGPPDSQYNSHHRHRKRWSCVGIARRRVMLINIIIWLATPATNSSRCQIARMFTCRGSLQVNCAAVIPREPAGTEPRPQRSRFVRECFLNRRRLLCIPSFWPLPAQVF
jgi:hypothetical protein